MIARKSKILVAHSPSTPEEAYGWICYSGKLVNYLYVKQKYRRFGVGSQLLERADSKDYWCRTKDGDKLATKMKLGFIPPTVFIQDFL